MILLKVYDGFIKFLVFCGVLCVAFITVATLVDVVTRNFNLRAYQSISALVEYGLLFCTMAVAPYLVRTNGHVAVQSFVEHMPSALQALVSKMTLLFCIIVLALVSWRAAVVAVEVTQAGAIDMRSVDFPGWVLYAMLSTGFGLMAVEFLMLLLRGERFHGSQGEN